MLPSERMAKRAMLFRQLTLLDEELQLGLTHGFGVPDSSLRAAEEARKLLVDRRSICAEMVTVGYQPWDIPVTVEQEKAI